MRGQERLYRAVPETQRLRLADFARKFYAVPYAMKDYRAFDGQLDTIVFCLANNRRMRIDYAEADLYRPTGRYGDIRPLPIALLVVCTAIGWGLVTNTQASWLTWQGYLLGPLGLGGKTGDWAYANLGVLVALVIAFGVTIAFGRSEIRAQERAA